MIISKFLKIKKIIKLICVLLLIFIAIILLNNSNKKLLPSSFKNIDDINIVTEKNLINEIKNTNKIIPLEVELSKLITIDKSFGNLEIFEKYKRIKFFANCSYYIDLSELKDGDIQIDEKNNKLNIKIPKPEIFNINILRDKTIYEDTSTGLLRFGDIKLTSEEFDIIQDEVYKSFNKTLEDKEMYNNAINSSKLSIASLIKQIIGKDVDVNISFK